MDFSGIAYCADNKGLSFKSFPIISSGFVSKTPNMGVHNSNDMPFVELTGHQDTSVHSTFGISDLSGFGISGKFNSFAGNTKPFARSDSFMARKDLCGTQFPAFSISQLVGGFVGSKSQIGSSSKESCQIWDIVLGKLAEFCDSHHHPQNCFNFSKSFTQEVLESFCQNNINSHIVINNSKNTTPIKTTQPNSSSVKENPSPKQLDPSVVEPNSSATQDVPDCAPVSNSDISKQSYADVAKIFAVTHQTKQQSSTLTMPRRRNPPRPYYKGMTKSQITRPIECNWRSKPSEKEYRQQANFFSGFRKRPDYNRNTKSNRNFAKDKNTDVVSTQKNTVQTQRARSEKDWRRTSSDKVQNVSRVSPCKEVPVAGNRTSNSDQNAPASPLRKRFMSECSTDSDDSFVVFESDVDCDSIILALVHSSTSESELSEDICSYQCFEDEEDYEDSDDAETVTELSEVNEKWERENSGFPRSHKNPVKVQFAEESDLETVHPMVTWNFAYRAARRGPWEEMARDRERFKCRVKQAEVLLAPVLTPEHRSKVWKQRLLNT